MFVSTFHYFELPSYANLSIAWWLQFYILGKKREKKEIFIIYCVNCEIGELFIDWFLSSSYEW